MARGSSSGLVRIGVANTIGTRDETTNKDGLLQNGYAELKEGKLRAVKRPALDSAYTATTGQGQGLFTWTTPDGGQQLVSISNDTLNYGSSITTLTKALRFVVPPATPQNIATSFTPDVTVEAISKAGKRVASFTSNVTVALADNPTGTTLGGTLTHAAVAGLATFNNLTSTRSGSDFSLAASASGLRGDISVPFSIPTHLVFTTQPGFAQVGDPVVAVVTAQDTDGNTDTNFTGSVTVSLFSNPTSAILSGTTTETAVAGVASFADLAVNIAGTYTLKAESAAVSTSYKPSSAVSDAFTIGPYVLTINADTSEVDVLTEITNIYGTPAANAEVNITVGAGVIVSSTSSNPALSLGIGWSGTPTFTLVNNGWIIGHGGVGGDGGVVGPAPSKNGGTGFPAMRLLGQTISITNASGFIWGGGGAGGGGGRSGVDDDGGSGGGGAGNGAGGPPPTSPAEAGQDASATGSLAVQTGGAGGASNSNGGDGGAGGDYGLSGTAGAIATSPSSPPGTGGAAGNAIELIGGTANFISGSGSPNVLGAVS